MDPSDIFDFFSDTVGCAVGAIIIVVLLLICAACVFGLFATGAFD